MEINARRHAVYSWVVIKDGGTTIDLGMLDDDERDDLAQTLINAAYEVGPKYHYDCEPWFAGILEKCGIKLPNVKGDASASSPMASTSLVGD